MERNNTAHLLSSETALTSEGYSPPSSLGLKHLPKAFKEKSASDLHNDQDMSRTFFTSQMEWT